MDIMRGDARWVPVELSQNGEILTAEMVEDIEISVESLLRKTLSAGEVEFDAEKSRWRFRLTQEDTLKLPLKSLDVVARIKYLPSVDGKADVIGVRLGRLTIIDGQSEAVL